jgi:hypothetical protein
MRWIVLSAAALVFVAFLRVTWDLWRSRKTRPLNR